MSGQAGPDRPRRAVSAEGDADANPDELCAVCRNPVSDRPGEQELIEVFGVLPSASAPGRHKVHPGCREKVNENAG